MSDQLENQLDDILRQDIFAGTAKIAWTHLQSLFASGKVIYVAHNLDLIETALQISNDNTEVVKEWMENGKLAHISDEQARLWINSDASVWAVVIKPWVLVQDIEKTQHEH